MPENSNKDDLKKHINELKKEIDVLLNKKSDLRVGEDRFKSIFNSMEEIYFEINLRGDLVYCNPALSKISGSMPIFSAG